MITRFLRPLPVVTSLLVLLLAGGCRKDVAPPVNQAAIDAQKKVDDDAIQAYVAAQQLRATRTASGIYYVVLDTAAAGAVQATPGKRATLNYYGCLLSGTADGTQFDSSYARAEPLSFVVGDRAIIAGWNEIVALMRKGDRWRVLIPSYLAYGPAGSGRIPPNAPLVFYMKLENVQ